MASPLVHLRATTPPPFLTAGIAILALAVFAIPGAAPALQFDRAVTGEPWRILACHLSHWTPDHFAWSLLAFVVLGAAAEAAGRVRFVVCVIASALVIPPVVSWTSPGLATYRGLSGIDTALFALVLAEMWRRGGTQRLVALLAGTALGGKIAYECVAGHGLFVSTDTFIPVPAAHAAGAAVGLVVGLWRGPKRSKDAPATGQFRRARVSRRAFPQASAREASLEGTPC